VEAKSLLQYPELLKEWNHSRNGAISPSQVTPGSSKKYWWRCVLGHEWEARVASRTKGARCPFCINQRVLPGFNDLATTHPEQANYWHAERNHPLKPDQIVSGSNKKVWWLCDQGHEFEMTVWDRVGRNRGCKFCSNNAVFTGFNDFETLHPDLVYLWDVTKNLPLTPNQVQPKSDRKAWFICLQATAGRQRSRTFLKDMDVHLVPATC
jgi:hypothetical protein